MGVRHRLRRPRPRPVERPQREHPRARHRGVLQHRRSGVEGDAPWRGRQVRRRRQERAARRTSARSPGPTATSTSPRSRSGANDIQATKAMVEAEAWPGPSLVIAYSTCIAHGIDMSTSMTHQKDAVRSGYWPLYRFSPSAAEDGTPFHLDSKAAGDPGLGVRRHRGPLRGAGAHQSRTGRRAGGVAAGRRRRALALLLAAGDHRAHRPARHAGRRHGGRTPTPADATEGADP